MSKEEVNIEQFKGRTVVEVAMEVALTPEILDELNKQFNHNVARHAAMSTSVGGIGPLLRERMVAMSNLGVNVIGVSLLYDRVWKQRWYNWGQLYLERVKVASYLRQVMKEVATINIKMYDGTTVPTRVWLAEYGNAKMYFLDEPEINISVYPGKEDALAKVADPVEWAETARRKQSWLLGRGMLTLMKYLNQKPDFIVMSETPTIFAHNALITDEFQHDPLFEDTKYVFNDHTPLEYAHPMWTIDTLKQVHIDPHYYKKLHEDKELHKVDITQLLIFICEGVYGVAAKHGDVMRQMPTLKKFAKKIQTVTNGVSVKYWQCPELANYKNMSDDEIIAVKDRMKNELADWVWFRYKLWSKWRELAKQRPMIVWSRRITSYKRMDILSQMLKNRAFAQRLIATQATIIIGGRIHQQDDLSRRIIFDLLDQVAVYPRLEEQIVVLDNYNVWEAPKMFHGADASIMISDAGREASATGFMKAQLNGGIIIACSDGAIPESVIFANGENNNGKMPNGFQVHYQDDQPTSESLLSAIEQFTDNYRNKTNRVKMIRAALDMTEQVSVERTVRETLALFHEICGTNCRKELAGIK
ncbi:MAG: glycogen/starch/alpha-glucan phosphorylase [Elusimicrobiota bacterium]